MSYRNDDDAATFRADRLEAELTRTKTQLSETQRALAAEIAQRPMQTNVALEAMAITGAIFGTLGFASLLILAARGGL